MKPIKSLFLLLALLASFSFGAAWTGSNSEPENMKKIDGKSFYVITTPEELAWIAAQVNNGNNAINAVLANDIVFGANTSTVNTTSAWTPIGKDSTHTFKGILDGAGFSIYGVYTKGSNYGGLVGVLAKEGVVRNVNMKKASINALNYAGGLVAYNFGTVSGCTNSGSVSSNYSYSGGIAGYNTGTVSNCTNSGSVSFSNYSDYFCLGGIAGYNTGTVSNCTNSGSISASSKYSGGIAGYNSGSSAIIRNSYSVATSLSTTYALRGGLVGENKSSAQVINCYYDSDKLTGLSAIGSNSATATNATGLTTANMQRDQFAWILNTTNGTEANSKTWSRNGGYPIFANASNLPIYKVIFNDDGTTSNRYTNYQGLVTFPSDPEPAEGYMFSGWFNSSNVKVKSSTVFSADQTVNAVYIEASNVYFAVRFFNADTTLLDSQSVQYGKTPAYAGTPTLPSTAEFSYAFAGWHVEPTAATEDFDYYATYTQTTNSYTVTFLDYDGTKLQESSYLYGATPGYAKTPTRASTVAYDYTFAGWNPAVVKVVANAEYKAIYDSSLVKYTVTFMNGSEVFATQQVAYGTSATAPEPAPTRDGYKFIGWTPSFAKIVGDLTVSALFEELILRDVLIYSDDGKVIDTAKVEENTKYVLPDAPEKEGYEFVGWYDGDGNKLGMPGDTITVTGDLKITAKYEEIKFSSSSANSSSSVAQSSSSAIASSSSAMQSSSSMIASSSSAMQSSSSAIASSSSAEQSSSSGVSSSSSSEDPDALHFSAHPRFNLHVQNRTLQIQNARIGSAFAVLDLQGRVLRRGVVNSPEFSMELQNAGAYIVRIDSQVQKIRVK
ncbi:Listeria/Bacterioides repeat-containing protein [Fibrobacter intestinalis]|uniref:Listeria/Bacterioides repeat-containing protein n=1 Tax=Fibrobacter intestinalis TaxID=28122 RepID=A0A1M6SEP2_9BACT|nr:InlB B-repeat-containing protein [Fibrobacter intestinalis]SHK43191.1 Listeria/Bacterioides repeat-containing protein [Fibrobacter intestinalis]